MARTPHDPELTDFAHPAPLPKADPGFRDALRSQLWELVRGLFERLRGR